jgi:hypothetical protein
VLFDDLVMRKARVASRCARTCATLLLLQPLVDLVPDYIEPRSG